MTKRILLLGVLFLQGETHLSAATPFEPGQVWTYETRASESQSRVAVLRIDTYPKAGRIVHVAVIGLRLRRTPAGPVETWQIGHVRLSEKALRKSVTKLDPDAQAPVIPGFEEEHLKSKMAADQGDVHYWHLPIRDIVQEMEKWIQKGKKS